MRGLRQKLDALRVQNGQSLSKYHGFIRKLICDKGISFFKLILTPDFLCVQYAPFMATSSILNPFLTSFPFFMYLMIFFELNDREIEKHYKGALKGWNLAWYHNFTHIACAKKLRGLRQKLDALHVQTGQSLSKYHGFERKLIYYKGTSFSNLF